MAQVPVSNFDRQEVVASFTRFVDLSACEKHLFDKYAPPGRRVLDLGMGAGRTTAYLAPRAATYVGIDLAPNMVAACRERFPQYAFETGDAADLSRFRDSTFDVVVFSFNGIDYLPSQQTRLACLRECHRVLSPGGVMILSVHNPRHIFFRPILAGAPLWKKLWRLAYAGLHSVQLFWRLGFSQAFRKGHGYLWDPTDGGTRVHLATPSCAIPEFEAAGFEIVECLSQDFPVQTGPFTTPWYYYALSKRI